MSDNPIYTRRSIRKFKEDDITVEQIQEIIRAGIAAPSAKNRQPWKCIVMSGKSKTKLMELMRKGIEREENGDARLPGFEYGLPDAKNTLRVMEVAPVIIVVYNTNGRTPFESVDTEARIVEICDSLSIGAFIQNMLLQADQMGIGTLWIANTCFAYEEIDSYFDVEGQLIGAIALGYADEFPNARPRKSMDEVVEYRG